MDPWTRLGLQWLEMMSASSYVIARRTRRQPSPAQLYGMGSEKLQAGMESWHALARQSLGTVPAGMRPDEVWARWVSTAMRPFHARAVRNARIR
jgi:hypothetical protein